MKEFIAFITILIIGILLGYFLRTPKTVTEYETRIDTIYIPPKVSVATSQGKPIERIIVEKDSLTVDSLKSLIDWLADPFMIEREDSILYAKIKSYPLEKIIWDSIYVKPFSITRIDTTIIKNISGLNFFDYTLIGLACLISFLFGSLF